MPNMEQKLLQDWAKTWRQEHLSSEVRKFIGQAIYDLWYGPISEGGEEGEETEGYPGFVSATNAIKQALTDLPSDLYIDTDCEQVSENAPQPEECEECQGEGTLTNEEGEEEKCMLCNGDGHLDPAGEWWHVERSDIRQAVVGKELCSYIW